MLQPSVAAVAQNGDDIEADRLLSDSLLEEEAPSGVHHAPLLQAVHRDSRPAPIGGGSHPHLDEGDQVVSLHDEVQLTTGIPNVSRNHPVARLFEQPRCGLFSGASPGLTIDLTSKHLALHFGRLDLYLSVGRAHELRTRGHMQDLGQLPQALQHASEECELLGVEPGANVFHDHRSAELHAVALEE